ANDYAFFAYDRLCGSTPAPDDDHPASSCQEADDLLPAQLRRLTRLQFKNTVEAVLGALESDSNSNSASIWPDFEDSMPTIGMSNHADALRINALNLESVYRSVTQIVDLAVNRNTTLRNCAASTSAGCVGNILDNYGALLWRRPLNSLER